jgi:hypothetical protein
MHPKVKRAYEEAKFQVPANPADTNEEIFRRKTKRARPEDVKVVINQVWRTSQGPNKDFIFYEKKEIIPDLAGNEDTLTKTEGKYRMPKFTNVYNNQTGDVESVALRGFETQYDIPYSPQKMREILESGDSSNTIFTLVINDRKYGGFSAEDFIDRPYDELVQLAYHGQITNPVSKSFDPSKIRASGDTQDHQQRRRKEIEEEEEVNLQNAYDRAYELEQKREEEVESEKRKEEEEAEKRQKAVDKQLEKRVVTAEAPASFDREPPTTRSSKRKQGSNRPEVEQIKEEVVFHLGRPEDQNVNEDEEIARQFKAQEEAKQSRTQKNKQQEQSEE